MLFSQFDSHRYLDRCETFVWRCAARELEFPLAGPELTGYSVETGLCG
jgi:hypothetical protein